MASKSEVFVPLSLSKSFCVHSCVPYTDLCLMSLCQGAILAPSTLGWWGAWLQNGKGTVVAPKKWFGSQMSHLDLSDLFPDNWITLDD